MAELHVAEHGEFRFLGAPHPIQTFRLRLSRLFNPDLAGVIKPDEEYTAEELALHIKPELDMRKHVHTLSRLPFMEGMRTIESSFTPFYLDPDIRQNLALYSQNYPDYTYVYRRIGTTEHTTTQFDIWGLRQDIGYEEVAKSYARQKEKAPKAQVAFLPKPA